MLLPNFRRFLRQCDFCNILLTFVIFRCIIIKSDEISQNNNMRRVLFMKKIILISLAAATVFATTACGGVSTLNQETTAAETTVEVTTEEPTTEEPTTEKPTEPPTTEKPTESPKQVEKKFKNSCETIDFETLSRNPDKYKDNNYKFTGEVIQVQESSWGDTVDLRINITKKTYEYIDSVNWTDTIYATVEIPEGEDRILEDDILTFWGTCDGSYSYTSVMGSKITLPKIDIKYYKIDTE